MRPKHPRLGFSLIEVIAAMSVLAIIMLLISQAYTSVNGSWRDGMVSSDQNAGGRAALAFMARELSQAVVNNNLQMVVRDESSDDSSIWFSTLDSRPRKMPKIEDSRRQFQDIRYHVKDDGEDRLVNFKYRTLRRIGNYKLGKLPPYSGGGIESALAGNTNLDNGAELLPFVHKFKVDLHGVNRTSPAPVVTKISNPFISHQGGALGDIIPVYADLYLEVLGQDVAQVCAEGGLSGSEKDKYLQANLQRFTTRVYFHNIAAYNRTGP